jgi:potassium efflux system protein
VSAVVGLWAIWAQVFPALEFLDRLSLWQHTVVIDGQEQLRPITLANVFLAIAFAIVTAVAARSSPGLLEIVLLQRLSLDAGSRYAVSTVARYAISALGLVLVFNTIGGSWSQIQWLVAALSVGLGFGLQEIFANFVSGLIILFERPIRVGDTVTVGDVHGTVSKIQIRATWITAFDRKELIVPNKEFVTGRLINWTLSDSVLRVDLPVGIAYGSDTNRAIDVLTEVARESWRVLNDPPPQVLFLGFGDSSLSFELRVYIRNVSNLLPVTHELHMNIDKAFREAGIEIAFPQRDLHLRSLPERWIAPSGSAK